MGSGVEPAHEDEQFVLVDAVVVVEVYSREQLLGLLLGHVLLGGEFPEEVGQALLDLIALDVARVVLVVFFE